MTKKSEKIVVTILAFVVIVAVAFTITGRKQFGKGYDKISDLIPYLEEDPFSEDNSKCYSTTVPDKMPCIIHEKHKETRNDVVYTNKAGEKRLAFVYDEKEYSWQVIIQYGTVWKMSLTNASVYKDANGNVCVYGNAYEKQYKCTFFDIGQHENDEYEDFWREEEIFGFNLWGTPYKDCEKILSYADGDIAIAGKDIVFYIEGELMATAKLKSPVKEYNNRYLLLENGEMYYMYVFQNPWEIRLVKVDNNVDEVLENIAWVNDNYFSCDVPVYRKYDGTVFTGIPKNVEAYDYYTKYSEAGQQRGISRNSEVKVMQITEDILRKGTLDQTDGYKFFRYNINDSEDEYLKVYLEGAKNGILSELS